MRTQKYYRHKKKQTRKKRRHKKTRQRGASNYGADASAHRLTGAIKTLERQGLERPDLTEVVDKFTSLISITSKYKPEKGFIPEIIPYPQEEISDEVLTGMGFVDEAVVDVGNLGDLSGPTRINANLKAAQEAAAAGMLGYTGTRRNAQMAAEGAVTASDIGQNLTQTKSNGQSSVFTEGDKAS